MLEILDNMRIHMYVLLLLMVTCIDCFIKLPDLNLGEKIAEGKRDDGPGNRGVESKFLGEIFKNDRQDMSDNKL